MAKKDKSALWFAGGIAALGLIAMASSSREPERQSFEAALRSELLDLGLRLVSAELGRLHNDRLWVVTCETPDGRLLRVQVPVSGPPYQSPKQVARDAAQALAAA